VVSVRSMVGRHANERGLFNDKRHEAKTGEEKSLKKQKPKRAPEGVISTPGTLNHSHPRGDASTRVQAGKVVDSCCSAPAYSF
jgi:hypothetical protein